MRRNAVIRATLVVLFVLFLNFSNAVGQEKHYRYKYIATEYQLVDGKFGNKEYKVQNSRFSSYIVLSFSADRKNAWLTSGKKELAFYDGKKLSDNIYKYFDNGFDQYGGLFDYMENATDEAHTTMLVSPKYSRVHILYLEPTPGNKKKSYTRCDIYVYENKASVSPEVQRERNRKKDEHYKRIADLEDSVKKAEEEKRKAEEEKRKARKFVYNDKSVYTDENGKVVDSSIFKRGCKTLVVTHMRYCRPSDLLLKYVKNIDCDVIVITFGEDQPKRHILPNATNIYLKDNSTWHFGYLVPCYLLVDGNGEVLEWHTGFDSNNTSKIDKMVAAIQDDKLYSQRVPKNEIWYLSNNGKISVRDNFSAKCLSHTYVNGKGVIKFDKELTKIGYRAFANSAHLTKIVIPDGVTEIEESAFRDCTSLTSVTIPNRVTSIGSYAFAGCSSMTSITIPDSVTSIGDYAFDGCTSLTSVTIPNRVTSIGYGAFNKCTSLTSVTIPDSVTLIGNCAFENCTSLTSVTIGNSVTSIGTNAFHDCIRLTSVTIPNRVTSIGSYAFAGCRSMTSITIPDSVTYIGNNAFAASGIRELVLPQGLTSVPEVMCYNCRQLTSVVFLGENVTSIGSYAFRYCEKLTDVVIPDKVSGIASFAFADCSSLKSVTLPKNLTSIGYAAFYNCRNLESIEIPAGVTQIEGFAFADCDKLKTVVVPDGVESIGEAAFSTCDNIREITIPKSVTSIGSRALNWCRGKLVIDSKILETDCEEKTIPSDNKESWLNLSSFSTVVIGGNVKKIGAYTFAKYVLLQNLTLPEGLVEIGDSAFWRCSVKDLTIPKSVTSIGKNAFVGASGTLTINSKIVEADCADDTAPKSRWLADTKFKKIILGDGITKIGARTFQDYTSVTAVTIPNGVTSIGDCAFFHNVNLSSVTIEATTPPQLGADVFSECYSKCFVYVPDSSIKAYKKSWKKRLSAGVKLVKLSKKTTSN